VGGSLDVTVLDFAGGFCSIDVDWEEDLEEFVGFLPIHPGVESYARGWPKADSLFDRGIAERFGEFYGDPNWTLFYNFK
jgi:hypothetical protein